MGDQVKIAGILNAGCSCLSLASCLLFVGVHCKFQELHTLSLRLYSWMCVSDILSSISWFLIPEIIEGTAPVPGWRCQASAFLLNFGQLSSAFWGTVISHAIYSAIVKGNINQSAAHIRYFILAFIPALILSSVPFALQTYNNYGPVDYFCWIQIDTFQEIASNQIRMSLFYLPLWLLFLIQILLFYQVDRFEKRIAEANNLQHKTHYKLIFYAVVFVFTWISPTILRTLNGMGKTSGDIFPLACLAIVSARLHGFLSSLIYLFNRRILKLMGSLLSFSRGTLVNNVPGAAIEMNDLSAKCQKSIFKEEQASPSLRPRSRPIFISEEEGENDQEEDGNNIRDEIQDRDLSFLSIDL